MKQFQCGTWVVGSLMGLLVCVGGCSDGKGLAPSAEASREGTGGGESHNAAGDGSGGAGDAGAAPDLLPASGADPALPGKPHTTAEVDQPAPDAAPRVDPTTSPPARTSDDAGAAPPPSLTVSQVDMAPAAAMTVPPGGADAGPGPTDLAPAKDGPPRTYPSPSPLSVALYAEETIVDYYLTFPPGSWDLLLTLNGPSATRWVQCTFTTLGGPVVDAACRRKGNMTDWPYERKPQIIVRFNLLNKQGRYRGLRRFNLESFDGAAAPIRDRIGMWVMREAGLDAPRVNHVRVFKDGALLGVYMNIETEDKEFLEDHFGPMADTGNLWEGGDQLNTNEVVNDHSRLNALHDLIDAEPLEGDHAAFYAQIASKMDVAEVLREMAAETVLITNDNFSQGSTNFAYYEHPTRGFMVLPWDLDSIITVAPPSTELYAFKGVSTGSKLRELMNQNPTWKAQFNDHLVDIRDNIMPRAAARAEAVCGQIRAVVATDPNRTSSIEDFDADCANVKNAILQRIADIRTLLGR